MHDPLLGSLFLTSESCIDLFPPIQCGHPKPGFSKRQGPCARLCVECGFFTPATLSIQQCVGLFSGKKGRAEELDPQEDPLGNFGRVTRFM